MPKPQKAKVIVEPTPTTPEPARPVTTIVTYPAPRVEPVKETPHGEHLPSGNLIIRY